MNLKLKYGNTALVAGASEGIGAAYSTYLAAQGMDLVLIARRQAPLQLLAQALMKEYSISVTCINCDLADPTATQQIIAALNGASINLLVYNAGLSYIGSFEKNSAAHNHEMLATNVLTAMNMVHLFGERMLQDGKGAVILMSSLAGFQGSGYLAIYAATKAFTRVFAESLWYEWKNRGVDIMACCAGATSSPNFINTHPGKTNFFAPKVQTPEAVVQECFEKLGKQPSFVTGGANKMASFIMQRILPGKMAINIMGDTTKKMYRL
ncbi:MAG: SDR family NAD(P)-dependent oxidoreductase [Chitinophagales bacterium]|nr:SDR family NAD(P)-dependent oxidoreductase [Chitinophagales bacterium]